MDDLNVNGRVTIPAAELEEAFTRASGPGGQHVNKVSTAVVLRWRLRESSALTQTDRDYLVTRLGDKLTADGELVVTAGETHSQSTNRERARAKLATLIREGLRRPRVRRATRPTRSSVKKRLTAKRQLSEKKRARRFSRDD